MVTRIVARSALVPLLIDGLFMPTGLAAVIYLAHRLGPSEFAVVALAQAIIAPVAWAVTLPFAGALSRLVAHDAVWQQRVMPLLGRQLLVALAAVLLLWLAADVLATATALPALAPALRLFAVEVPLLALARLYGNLCASFGLTRLRARGNIGRMLARPFLIVLLVESGLGIQGALLGTLGVSVIHLAIIMPGVQHVARSPRPANHLAGTAISLAHDAVMLYQRVIERLDLVMLAAFGGGAFATQSLGIYAVAQFLPIPPVTIADALLASLRSHRPPPEAQAAAYNAVLRVAVAPLPFAALAAGAAPEIISLLFGAQYRPGAPLLAILCLAAALLIMAHACLAILGTRDKPTHTLMLFGGLVPAALALQILGILTAQAIGAALATLATAACTATVTLLLLRRAFPLRLPLATWTSCALLGVVVYLLAALWPTPGLWVVGKLTLLALLLLFALLCTGAIPSPTNFRRRDTICPSRWVR